MANKSSLSTRCQDVCNSRARLTTRSTISDSDDYRDALTRLARFKQLCAPEELKIKATKDERIPSRSERDRPLEIRFVEPGRLRAALQLDPFCRHKVPCAAATKFNERGKGGVC